jgi:tetratricopeptide (TPR) repeat protein
VNAENTTPPEDSQAEVWSAISAFEEILQAVPDDRVALETLHEAYDKIGDQAQALSYLKRLATVIIEEQDAEGAGSILTTLQKESADDDEESAQMIEKLSALKEKADKKAQEKQGKAETRKKTKRRRPVDITSELSLAWNLLQANEITQDDYNNIVHDLSENSTRAHSSPISVLHVLTDRQFKNEESILAHISNDSGVPFVRLRNFDLEREVAVMVPVEQLERRGAMVFGTMGDDALVAILNPYDMDLRQEIEESVGKRCHYFLVSAEEYDEYLGKIRTELAG